MLQTSRLGPFILDRMIGRGGMGAVYRARHESTDQIAAVKALLHPLEQDRERFEAEISTLKLLRHENIVRLFGFGQEDGVLYYAMEFVDGPSLSTLLKRGRRFSWEEVVYIGESVCSALRHAHDRGVVHRDIKPANILLERGGTVKVSDYGIAQYFGNSRLTNANQIVGTIEYMAPEQAQAGAVTPKTDMYSLGALMYALLAGKPPYPARSLPELLKKFRETYPAPIRQTRPEVPKVVDDLILDLLQIQPGKRPGDARLIGRRLQAILSSSANCPDGNPFRNRSLVVPPAPKKPVEEIVRTASSSRVDLENPSVQTRLANPDGEEDEFSPGEDRAPDFPYRDVDADQENEEDFESPFEKTTERALTTEEAAEGDDGARDDFELSDPDSNVSGSSDGTFSDNETSTGSAAVDANADDFDLSAESSAPSSRNASSAPVYDSATITQNSGAPASSDSVSEMIDLVQDDPGAKEPGRAEQSQQPSQRPARAPIPQQSVLPGLTPDRVPGTSTTVVEKEVRPEPRPAAPVIPEGQSPFESANRNVPFEALDQSSNEIEATPLEKFKKSQFTVVKEDELGELPNAPVARFRLARFLTLGFILAATVLIVRIVMRPPSPEKLFARIDGKLRVASDEEGRFAAALAKTAKDMERFEELSVGNEADEWRVNKVRYFLCEYWLDEYDQNLERQLQTVSRASSLEPFESRTSGLSPYVRAYLEARRAAQNDWETGEQKLSAFIDLYGLDSPAFKAADRNAPDQRDRVTFVQRSKKERRNPWTQWRSEKNRQGRLQYFELFKRLRSHMKSRKQGENSQDELIVLVILAQRRREIMRREVEATRARDLETLKKRLDDACELEATKPEYAARIRRGALELYGNCDWAAGLPELQAARKKLEEANPVVPAEDPAPIPSEEANESEPEVQAAESEPTPEQEEEPSPEMEVENAGNASSDSKAETPDDAPATPPEESSENPETADEPADN